MVDKFLLKLFLAALPILVMTGFYIATDPFLVVHSYPDITQVTGRHLECNEDYTTTEYLLHNNVGKHINAFVFGSSRAGLFRGASAERLFGTANYYNYSVASETLFGVERKIAMLDNLGFELSSVLIGIDPGLLATTVNSKGHLYKKHPAVSGESMWDFQLTSYLDIYSLDFITGYWNLLRGKHALSQSGVPYILMEKAIASNIDSFYNARSAMFPLQTDTLSFSNPVIGNDQYAMLDSIAHICSRRHCKCYLVIYPCWDQVKMAPADVAKLVGLFGQSSVFDFSGKNAVTADRHNYYEGVHFRQKIADWILDSLATSGKTPEIR